MLAEGSIVSSALIVAMCVLSYFFVKKAYVKAPTIRRMPALDAIEESVERCSELGKAVLFSVGGGRLTGSKTGPPTYAAMSALTLIARTCARLGVPLIQHVCFAEVLPLEEAVTEQAYSMEGKTEEYKPENMRYAGDSAFAWEAAILSSLRRDNIGTAIHIGCISHQAVIIAGAGAEHGAFQIAGTNTIAHMAFYVTLCDYFLIAEEIYAAGAYLSGEPLQLGTLVAEDMLKIALMVLMFLGIILSGLGNPWLFNLMKM